MKVDEKGLEAAAKAIQKHEGDQPSRCDGECYYDQDWREYIPQAQAAITAYEAAKTAEGAVAWVQAGYIANLHRFGSFPMRASKDAETGYVIPLYVAPPSPQDVTNG